MRASSWWVVFGLCASLAVLLPGCGGAGHGGAAVATRVAGPSAPPVRAVANSHQADQNADGSISIDELTAYIQAWKTGQYDNIDLVTNAIGLWKTGESYHYDAAVTPHYVSGPLAGAGSVQVTISPAEAVTAGAKWTLDSGTTPYSSGDTVTSVSAGNHTVKFTTVTGWTTPADQTASVTAGQTTGIAGTYTLQANATGATLATQTELDNEPGDLVTFAAANGSTLPSKADADARYLPPVGNQNPLGTCVGWGTGYGGLTYLAAKAGSWLANTSDHEASACWLYGAAKQVEGYSTLSAADWRAGTQPRTACNVAVTKGCATMARVPYTNNPPIPTDLSSFLSQGLDSNAAIFRIASHEKIDVRNRPAVKQALADGNVLVIGVPADAGLQTYRSGVYRYQGPAQGGHCMLLVGYDDAKSAYHIMNSWGTNWGESGYMWWDYTTFESATLGGVSPIEVRRMVSTGSTPTPTPTPTPTTQPTVQVTGRQVYNWYWDYQSYRWWLVIYLVFDYQYSQAVVLQSAQITSPIASPVQPINKTGSAGSVYWWKAYDNVYQAQWYSAGTYRLVMKAQAQDGTSYTYTNDVYVAIPTGRQRVSRGGREMAVPESARGIGAAALGADVPTFDGAGRRARFVNPN